MVRVRQATGDDASALASGNVRLAAESEDRTLDPAMVERGVRRIQADPSRGAYWVAEADGSVIGQCLVTTEWSDWSDGRYWWFQSVWVEPEWRGQGVFRALWDRVLDAAREAGDVTAIRLYVEEENHRAREVYERLGMELTGYRMYESPLPPRNEP